MSFRDVAEGEVFGKALTLETDGAGLAAGWYLLRLRVCAVGEALERLRLVEVR